MHELSNILPKNFRPTQAEEFLDWLDPGQKAELIDGEVFMHSPVHINHAELSDFLRFLLKTYVRRQKLGRVLGEVWAVRLGTRKVFMPDICYFDVEQSARLGDTMAEFAPKLAIEILSKSTSMNDRVHKFSAYEEHGVMDYWLIDPIDGEHLFYTRQGDAFTEQAADSERIEPSALPGFWIKPSWLDPKNLPDVEACYREIVGE